jgi:hypothetical protein
MDADSEKAEVRKNDQVVVPPGSAGVPPAIWSAAAPRRFGFRETLYQNIMTYAHLEILGTTEWRISMRSLRSFAADRKS